MEDWSHIREYGKRESLAAASLLQFYAPRKALKVFLEHFPHGVDFFNIVHGMRESLVQSLAKEKSSAAKK